MPQVKKRGKKKRVHCPAKSLLANIDIGLMYEHDFYFILILLCFVAYYTPIIFLFLPF